MRIPIGSLRRSLCQIVQEVLILFITHLCRVTLARGSGEGRLVVCPQGLVLLSRKTALSIGSFAWSGASVIDYE